MPNRPAIDLMPREMRDALDQKIIDNGFGGYQQLAEWLQERGYAIHLSQVHRRGQKLQRRLEAIKASTEAAKMIAFAAPDDEDSRSAAVLSMIQTELFDGLLAIQEANDTNDPAERIKLLSNAARAISEVSRASIGQKAHAEKVRAKAERAARKFEEAASKGAMTKETRDMILKEILGVAA